MPHNELSSVMNPVIPDKPILGRANDTNPLDSPDLHRGNVAPNDCTLTSSSQYFDEQGNLVALDNDADFLFEDSVVDSDKSDDEDTVGDHDGSPLRSTPGSVTTILLCQTSFIRGCLEDSEMKQ